MMQMSVSLLVRTANIFLVVMDVTVLPVSAPIHFKLHVTPVLPAPYNAAFHWVKADMVYTVSFHRLYFPFNGKDASGKRSYDVRIIDKDDLLKIQECMLNGLGLTHFTSYL